MKVLLINGSPHANGVTCQSLSVIAATLAEENIESEIYHIGNKPMQGCIGCYRCRETGSCVFHDEVYVNLLEKAKSCDGLVIGSPVYYAGVPGPLCAILDRLFFAGSKYLRFKPAAATVNCRRGGASAALDRLNKYLTYNQMPLATSQYWNLTHGLTPEEQLEDAEGQQILRTLARNLAWLLKAQAAAQTAGVPLPKQEEMIRTNFIR